MEIVDLLDIFFGKKSYEWKLMFLNCIYYVYNCDILIIFVRLIMDKLYNY